MASPPGPGGRDRCFRLVQAASGVRSVGRHVDRSPPPSPYPICVTARCSRLPHLLKGVRSRARPARTRTRCSVRPRSCAQPPICSRSSPLTAAKCSVRRLGRCAATGAGSQERRYVNVAASYRADPRLEGVKASFVESGFEARITPGPLLLATTGGLGGKLKLMPFQPGGASCPVKEILTEAAKRVAAEGVDHDLEVAPDREPKWSSHSLRRLADTVARRHREAMGVSEAEIDIYFGWHERMLLKEMQVHYEAMSPRERMLHAKITGMM